MRIVVIMFGFMATTEILGAPFCVVNAFGKMCYYYSADQCQQHAATNGGMCVPNDDDDRPNAIQQIRPQRSGAPFCVVTSYGRQCYFYDASSCQRQAQVNRGMCIPNPD